MLVVETAGGWRYSLQRFLDSEPFVTIDRERPDGVVRFVDSKATLPDTIVEFAAAVEQGEYRERRKIMGGETGDVEVTGSTAPSSTRLSMFPPLRWAQYDD